MTKFVYPSKTRSIALSVVAAAGLALTTTSVQAAPVTWLFGGFVDSVMPGSGGGFPPGPGDTTLSDMFSIGDPFSLSFSFDDATIGFQNTFPVPQPTRTYLDDTTNSIDINGHLFTVSAPDISGANQRRVTNSGATEVVDSDTNDDTSPAGNATSSIAGVDTVQLEWTLGNSIGNVLPDVPATSVFFPQTIDLADWTQKTFELVITDFDIAAPFSAVAKVSGTFETFEVVSDSGVPAPAPIALLGFGLLAMTGLRRRAA